MTERWVDRQSRCKCYTSQRFMAKNDILVYTIVVYIESDCIETDDIIHLCTNCTLIHCSAHNQSVVILEVASELRQSHYTNYNCTYCLWGYDPIPGQKYTDYYYRLLVSNSKGPFNVFICSMAGLVCMVC